MSRHSLQVINALILSLITEARQFSISDDDRQCISKLGENLI